jgi:hypothetical protein
MAHEIGIHPTGRNGFESVVAWRVRRLLAAGFTHELAERVARDCAFDLHALIDLTERGCPPQLAVRILSPLETRPRPC